MAIAVPRGSPPPASRHVWPDVVRDHQRRPPVDDGHDPGARLGGGDDERQGDLDAAGRRRIVVDELGVVALEIDEHAPERRRHPRLHQRAMIVETNRLAISPASCGPTPRSRAAA